MANKKNSQPFRTFNSNTIKRTIIVSSINESLEKFQTGIVCALRAVEKKLEKRINTLNEKCDAVIPFVSINIENSAHSIAGNRGIRVIAAPRCASDCTIEPEVYDNSDISHLIEIVVSPKRATSVNKEYVNAVYSVSSLDDLEIMVLDIMTDIAMFHSWSYLHLKGDDISFCRSISAAKVEYAIKNYLKMPEGILSKNPNYCSFAYCCYENGNFDCEHYEQIWRSFVGQYIVEEGGEVGVGAPIEEQLKQFTKIGHTSIKKIVKQYNNLKTKGPHILMVMSSMPKRTREAEKILNYFGKTTSTNNRWKNGTIKIVPLDKYPEIARFHPYVALYKIIKT